MFAPRAVLVTDFTVPESPESEGDGKNLAPLRFEECDAERTQEFTLSWCPSKRGCWEIVRQQWNFSPAGSTVEIEDYAVDLQGVSALELAIKPDIGRNNGIATLRMWRVGGRAT